MKAFAYMLTLPLEVSGRLFRSIYRVRSKDGLPLPQGAREIGKLRYKQYLGGSLLAGIFLVFFTVPQLHQKMALFNGDPSTQDQFIQNTLIENKILVLPSAVEKQYYQEAKIALNVWIKQTGNSGIAHPSNINPDIASALGAIDSYLGTGKGSKATDFPVPQPGSIDTRLTLLESNKQELPQGVCLDQFASKAQCDQLHRDKLNEILFHSSFMAEAELDAASKALLEHARNSSAIFIVFFAFGVFATLTLVMIPVHGLIISGAGFELARLGAGISLILASYIFLTGLPSQTTPVDQTNQETHQAFWGTETIPQPQWKMSSDPDLKSAELKLMELGYFKGGLSSQQKEAMISKLTADEQEAFRERLSEAQAKYDNDAQAGLSSTPGPTRFKAILNNLRDQGFFNHANNWQKRQDLIAALSPEDQQAISAQALEWSKAGVIPDTEAQQLLAEISYASVKSLRTPANDKNPIFLELNREDHLSFALAGFLSALIPFLMMFGPTATVQLQEYMKESKLWREWVVGQKGQDSARWGSILSYWHHDYTSWFLASHDRILKTRTSPLVLGQTLMLYDPSLGGRWIASTSEQHLLTIAGTGAGKTRDVIAMNTLVYNGGALIFDTKAEHVTNSWAKRKAYAPAYLLDPFSKNKIGLKSDSWNPLDEIDPANPEARERIKRLCQSIIPFPTSAREKDVHFVEVPRQLLAGFIAHILTKYPKEQQSLPAVYDLMVLGKEGDKQPDLEAWKRIGLEMWENPACNGLAQEAAKRLDELQGPERSGMLSTLSRSLEWVKDAGIEANLRARSSFSLSECKSKDATVYVIIPEDRITSQNRYLKVLYQTAFDLLDEHRTEQQKGSKRRVLFLFDEFEALGNFEPARQAALRKRSSFIKCWFILQNVQQLERFENIQDFLSNCDLQVFGISRLNQEFLERVQKALGEFTAVRAVMRDGALITEKEKRPLHTLAELAEVLDAKSGKQLFIPLHGPPMKLKRVPYFKVWKEFKEN